MDSNQKWISITSLKFAWAIYFICSLLFSGYNYIHRGDDVLGLFFCLATPVVLLLTLALWENTISKNEIVNEVRSGYAYNKETVSEILAQTFSVSFTIIAIFGTVVTYAFFYATGTAYYIYSAVPLLISALKCSCLIVAYYQSNRICIGARV
jgi:hypothetical protein